MPTCWVVILDQWAKFREHKSRKDLVQRLVFRLCVLGLQDFVGVTDKVYLRSVPRYLCICGFSAPFHVTCVSVALALCSTLPVYLWL